MLLTYIAKDGGSNLIISWDNIKVNINIEHNGTSSYQVVQVRTSESNQPVYGYNQQNNTRLASKKL